MATGNNALNSRVDSLVKYILDIKPYHTKLLGFTSEVTFSDSLSLTMTDGQPQHTIYHQNVWGVHDIPTLGTISDGGSQSRTFIIPPTVMPRFSVTDGIDYGQSPIGDDQALGDLTDSNGDGVPNSGYPWTASLSSSHQLGSNIIPVRLSLTSLHVNVTSATVNSFTATVTGGFDTSMPTNFGIPVTALELRVSGTTAVVDGTGGAFTTTFSGSYSQGFAAPEPSLPAFSDAELAAAFLYHAGFSLWAVVDTGRYAVPFHNGSKVRVNNVPKLFSDDYVVDYTRSFIQFVAGKHPANGDQLAFNLMNSDRMFISICDPFVQASNGYDVSLYDDVPYDTSAQADHFILTVSDAAPHRNIVSFVNLEPGTSKAQLESVLIYPSQLDGHIWEIVSDGFFSVTVQQVAPIVGPIERAFLNEPFDNGKIAFTLRAQWIEYYLSHGDNSYIAYDMLPYDDDGYAGPYDEADFWPNTAIKTQYGQPIDPLPPLHPPVKFTAVGELSQRLVDGGPQYIFELYTVPPRGSYIELRIEQAKQLNPRLQLSMHEHVSIVQLIGSPNSISSVEVYSTHDTTSVFP